MDNRVQDLKYSFMILQTNPKLTTNIKINVDSSDKIYLESFDTNSILSNISFKKFVVNPNSTYSKDLYNFYNKGNVATSFSYDVYKNKVDYNIETDFSNQFDNFYISGAQTLSSKLYTENIEYFAPLYLNENIPSYFTIFKLDNGVYSTDIEIFKNSIVVKTFDLTTKTNIGRYIRNYFSSISEIESLIVNVTDEYSYVNGIDYNSGNILKKPINIYTDYILSDRTVIGSDNYLTSIYENNGIVFPNILNLNFLFDDNKSLDESLVRYVGFYHDNYIESICELDIETLYYNNYNQEIIPNNISDIKKYNYINSITGCILPVKNSSSILPDITDFNFNTISYIKDSKDNLLTVNSIPFKNVFKLNDKNINLFNLYGSYGDKVYVDVQNSVQNNSNYLIKIIKELPNGFGISIFLDNTEILSVYADDSILVYDKLVKDIYFPTTNILSDTAKNIVEAINSQNTIVKAISLKESILLYSKFRGKKYDNLEIKILNNSFQTSYVEFGYNNFKFSGGMDIGEYCFTINSENFYLFDNYYVLGNDEKLYTARKSFYIDTTNLFTTKRKIVLETLPKIVSNQIILSKNYKIEFGKISIYPVKIFDNDFITPEFSVNVELLKENSHYKNNNIQLDCTTYVNSDNYLYELDNKETNEYNILSENENINLFDVSKVSPYISKFVSKYGNDIRNKPYRFNVSKSLGEYNRTPSSVSSLQNIFTYSHDWYIQNKPSYYVADNSVYDFYYDGNLTIEKLLDVSTDNLTYDKKYVSYFNNNKTIFRGVLIDIFDIPNNTNINYNINSIKKTITDKKYDGYRFISILLNSSNSFKEITIIKNNVFKFIALVINTNLENIDLDKTCLYALKNCYDSFGGYKNLKLNGAIDITATQNTGNYFIIKGIKNNDGIDTDFLQQLSITPTGKFNDIIFSHDGDSYVISDIFKVLDKSTLYCNTITKNNAKIFITPITSPSNILCRNISFYIVSGGLNYYKKIIENISFAQVFKDVNNGDPIIVYEDVSSNIVVKNNFLLSLKTSDYIVTPEYLLKSAYYSESTKNYTREKLGYTIGIDKTVKLTQMFRLSNISIIPKFLDIITYNSNVYKTPVNIYQTNINNLYKNNILCISSFNTIKNNFYNRVTNQDYKILQYNNTTDIKPIYPLVNEIVIGYSDKNILETNWNSNYYINDLTKDLKERYTTKRVKEDKNYFGSKIFKTKDVLLLEDLSNFKYSLENNTLKFIIDVEQSFYKYFYSKLRNLFDNDSDYQYYVYNNILKKYYISSVNLYVKKTKSSFNLDLSYMSKTLVDIQNAGLQIENSIYTALTNWSLNINYEIENFVSYNIGLILEVKTI